MKNLILLVFVSLIGFINAQGITNTLGGNTLADKFIVENSDADAGLVVTGEGNVGIGTTSPLSKLSVGGDGNNYAIIYSTTSDINGYSIFGEATGFASGVGVRGRATGGVGEGIRGESSGDSGVGIHGYATGDSGIGVKGTESAVNGANFGGYFFSRSWNGTGVYGESEKYGVYGTATASSGLHYGGFFKTENPSGRGVYATSSTSTGSAYGGVFEATQSSDGVGVYAAGKKYDFYAAGAGENYGAASSIRWKNNIVEIDNPLEKLAELRGVYFDWDEDHGGGHDVGCIAEEVGKVLPEIVVYEENGIDAEGMDYSKLTPLLIEAVKELRKIVEDQQQEIEVLKNR
ncbi:MAG: hypothetical protein GWP19_05095 [Planctomycetia bacterium]|nr:hypothetical protein [Planctomycetia bacterium]